MSFLHLHWELALDNKVNSEQTEEWLVKFSSELHKHRRLLTSAEEIKGFDDAIAIFLENSLKQWWTNGRDDKLQTTHSPDLFWKAVIAKMYPMETYRDVEIRRRSQNNN